MYWWAIRLFIVYLFKLPVTRNDFSASAFTQHADIKIRVNFVKNWSIICFNLDLICFNLEFTQFITIQWYTKQVINVQEILLPYETSWLHY